MNDPVEAAIAAAMDVSAILLSDEPKLYRRLRLVVVEARLHEHRLLCVVRKKEGHFCGRCRSLEADRDRLRAAVPS